MLNRNYIHDIKPSSRTQKRRQAFHRAHDKRVHDLEESFAPETPRYAEDRSGGGRGIWYVAVITILILFFALTFVFSRATVFATPRTGTVELSGPILAEKESRSGLSFEMLVLEDETNASVSAGEKTFVEKKAEGKVRLFNNNPTVQKLLIDTRLESKDGYIYKTKVATVIPAQKTEGGKKVPGSIDVDVYADEAGDVYNINEADLKIVGFRGSPKYETVYAKTITPIKGGFKGESYEVSDEELASNVEKLKTDLRNILMDKAKAELPENFVMYSSLSTIDFKEEVITESEEEGKATITQKGILNAVIFKEEELTNALVEKVISNTEENKVKIENLRDLNLNLENGFVVSDPENITDLKIIIEDKIKVVWEINEEEIKEALAGIRKRDFQSTMMRFKNIEMNRVDLKPFWKQSLPEKASSIKVVNTLEED